MKAIMTKYIGPTNTKGARIKANDGDGNSITIGYDHSLNRDAVHRKAAIALCEKMNWNDADKLVQGGYGNCEVFVWP